MQQIFTLEDGVWETELLTDELLEIFEATFAIHFPDAQSLDMHTPDFLLSMSSYWIDLVNNVQTHFTAVKNNLTPQEQVQCALIIKNLEERQKLQNHHKKQHIFMFCWSLPSRLHESFEVTSPLLQYVSKL